jgi:hypothetical protein
MYKGRWKTGNRTTITGQRNILKTKGMRERAYEK